MKQILIITPDYITKGKPVVERTLMYKRFFERNNYKVICKNTPQNLKELLILIFFIYRNNYKNILITMPPFRNWSIVFLPFINIILDIRDGWSIAIKSGYGNTVKPNRLKYLIAKFIEKMAIKKANLTITCTTGLEYYLQKISNKKILLLLNGYSFEDNNFVKNYYLDNKKNRLYKQNINFICVGKFSEYGKDKVKTVINLISKKYYKYKNTIKIVGVSYEQNKWLFEFIQSEQISNIKIELIGRKSKKEVLEMILKSDVAITIIRDPNYDFGTKIFDYILCDIPVFNYFESENNFTRFFKNYLDNNFSDKKNKQVFLREIQINKIKNKILDILI